MNRLAAWLLLGGICGIFLNPSVFAAGSGSVVGAGSIELGLRGLLDLDKSSRASVYLDTTLGYFIADGIEIGLSVLNGTTPTGQRDTFGLFSEYNYSNSTIAIPFGGGFFKHMEAPTDAENEDARLLGIYGGVKAIISPNVALATTFVMEFANRQVYGLPGERSKSNKEVNLGLKFFF